MQYNLSDSYFEHEEGIKLGDGVYFKLESNNRAVEQESKTL